MAMTTTATAGYQQKEYYPGRRKGMAEKRYSYKETREMTDAERAKRTGRYSGGTDPAAGERTPKESMRELGRGARSMQEGGNIFTRYFRRKAGREAEREALAARGEAYGVGKRLPGKTPHEKAAESKPAPTPEPPRMNPLRAQYAGEQAARTERRVRGGAAEAGQEAAQGGIRKTKKGVYTNRP